MFSVAKCTVIIYYKSEDKESQHKLYKYFTLPQLSRNQNIN